MKAEDFVAGKGVIVKWVGLRKQHHWIDALYNACSAGSYYGIRLVNDKKPKPRLRLTLAEVKRLAHRPTARDLTRMELNSLATFPFFGTSVDVIEAH